MVEDCFSEEQRIDNTQEEDKSIQVIPPWFKKPQSQPLGHQRQFSEHIPPKAVLQQLLAGRDDLPACVISYPIKDQPHSIQGTWLASKCEIFSEILNVKLLL